MQRETGSLTSKSCGGCSSTLSLVRQSDGSTAYEGCSKCFPAQAKPAEQKQLVTEQASKAVVVPPREVGTVTKEKPE